MLVAPVPVGVTLVTVGVYVAVTGVPFLSTRLTVIGAGVPTYFLSGVKVIEPSELMLYSPTPETVFVDCPSSKVIGFVSSIGTTGFPSMKVGVPFCS